MLVPEYWGYYTNEDPRKGQLTLGGVSLLRVARLAVGLRLAVRLLRVPLLRVAGLAVGLRRRLAVRLLRVPLLRVGRLAVGCGGSLWILRLSVHALVVHGE